MSADDFKTGPLSIAELQELWRSAVDADTYADPLIAAGDGHGLEAYGQLFAMLARVSEAVDVTTQAMFIKPWSGQTNDSAAGERKATVTLTFARTGNFDKPLVLYKGLITVEEQTTDWGKDVGEVVTTGRRYVLTDTLVFHPGDAGPFDVAAEALQPGMGFNNPRIGTLKVINQVGSEFNNDHADTIVNLPFLEEVPPIPAGADVNALNEADCFIPDHVGQYLQYTAGANIATLARIVLYVGPDLTLPNPSGGLVRLAKTVSVEVTALSGVFTPGELIQCKTGGTVVGYGTLLGIRLIPGVCFKLTIDLVSGDRGQDSWDNASGASASIDVILYEQTFVGEVFASTWRIMDWVIDWGLTVTNAAMPAGGRLGMLDTLGDERNIPRGAGESDAHYLPRVGNLADVVSPNALKRAINRILVPLGLHGCFREVGDMSFFPGMFYDAGGSAAGDAMHPPDPDPGRAHNFAYDQEEQVFTFAAPATGFEPGELIVQTGSGARGYALLNPAGELDGAIPARGDVFIAAAFYNVIGQHSGASSGDVLSVTLPSVLDRYKTYLDYAEYRGFFLVSLPRLSAGEFGFPYDGTSADPFPVFNAYDTGGSTAYDGYAWGTSAYWTALWAALNNAKAGGVGFELVIDETNACP